MARLFDDGSNQYLLVAALPVGDVPLTMSAWAYSDDLTIDQCLIQITDTGSNNNWYDLDLGGTQVGDPIRAVTIKGGSGVGQAWTTAPYPTNEWFHACAVFAATNSRAAYLNGGNKGTDATAMPNPASMDSTAIGMFRDSTPRAPMSGRIAEVAVWGAALTDEEVLILSEGYSPLLVRPQSLAAYWPLIRDTDDDIVGGYSMTPYNSPTIGIHPRVFYPGMSFVVPFVLSVGWSGIFGIPGVLGSGVFGGRK